MSRQLTDLPRMTQNEVSDEDILLIRDMSSQTDKAIKKSDLVAGGGGGADLDTIFPIGTVRIFADNLDHSDDYGMTWERFAQGKTLVGIDSEDADFDNVGDTGGSKAHKHDFQFSYTEYYGSIPALSLRAYNAETGSYPAPVRNGSGTYNGNSARSSSTASSSNNFYEAKGKTGDGSSLQPYIVVSFWRRTA